MTLRLLSYNIERGGAGRDGLIAKTIAACEPDIVILQEATRPDVVRRLADSTGMPVLASRAGYSLAMISKVGVEHHEWHNLGRAGRDCLEVVLAGSNLHIFGVHLSAVHASWTERRRVRELGVLLKVVEPHSQEFHVLTGDFNTLAPGETLDARRLPPRLRALVWLSGGRVRYETIRLMLDAGYLDGYRLLSPRDKGFTFPTWEPHVRLDYAFLPAASAAKLKACEVVTHLPDATRASDHFPLLTTLDV